MPLRAACGRPSRGAVFGLERTARAMSGRRAWGPPVGRCSGSIARRGHCRTPSHQRGRGQSARPLGLRSERCFGRTVQRAAHGR